MFGWAIALALIALVTVIAGFGGLAGTLVDLALIIFLVALIGAAIMLSLGLKAGKAIVGD